MARKNTTSNDDKKGDKDEAPEKIAGTHTGSEDVQDSGREFEKAGRDRIYSPDTKERWGGGSETLQEIRAEQKKIRAKNA